MPYPNDTDVGRDHWPHDFCLTANGHGAGFWDGDYKHGYALTELCRPYHYDAYVGDDGLVYIAGMETIWTKK